MFHVMFSLIGGGAKQSQKLFKGKFPKRGGIGTLGKVPPVHITDSLQEASKMGHHQSPVSPLDADMVHVYQLSISHWDSAQ